MDLRFRISNINSDTYPIIMIRKFFQMVFIGNDQKSLSIYTATVLSACKECDDIANYISFCNITDRSIIDSKDFKVSFELNINDEDKDKIKIISEDMTKSFLQQKSRIEQVWGECTNLEKQPEVKQKLESLFNISVDDSLTVIPEGPVMFIDDATKHTMRKIFQSIAIKGEYNKIAECKNKYIIKTPSDKLHSGYELINWVKTTVLFEERITSTNLSYAIEFDNNNTSYFTPDFTLYFAPPTKTQIDYNTATAAVNNGPNQSNKINPVAHRTTIDFTEWSLTEKIESRNKCRLIIEKNVPINSIKVNFSISKKEQEAVRQFFFGILASSIIAFGIDYTRLTNFADKFPFKSFVPTDFAWIFLILLFLFLITQKPEYNNVSIKMYLKELKNLIMLKSKDNRYVDVQIFLLKVLRFIGALAFCVWFLGVFWFSFTFPEMVTEIKCIRLYEIAFAINFLYLTWYFIKYRHEIFVKIF